MSNVILSPEVWADIPSYESLYQVSNKGKIKSLIKERQIQEEKFFLDNILNGPFVSQYFNPDGYKICRLVKDGVAKTFLVHRLVGFGFVENPLNKPEINHKDGVKYHNWAGNLEWSTSSENTLHAHRTGLLVNPKGEKAHNSKLSNEQALAIKASLESSRLLSKRYNVSRTTIDRIKAGLRYIL